MKAISRILLVALFGFFAIGCDTEPKDADKFVGVWTLTKITDGRGDITTAFKTSVATLRVTMNADGTDKFEVLYTAAAKSAGATDVSSNGTYAVNDVTKQVTLTQSIGTLPLGDTFTEGKDTEVTFSAASTIVNAIFGSTSYTGTVNITATKG